MSDEPYPRVVGDELVHRYEAPRNAGKIGDELCRLRRRVQEVETQLADALMRLDQLVSTVAALATSRKDLDND